MEFNLSNFLFNTPLYSPILIDSSKHENLRALLDGNNSYDFDGYNPYEKKESTFKITTNHLRYNDAFLQEGGFITIKAKCKRSDNEFSFHIFWQPSINKLSKIGQYPTVADFHISEIKQYKKLLPSEKLAEFTRAIGLAANGVGIGSFVYLRRIFEYLILQAFNSAKHDEIITEADFQPARMDQKIDLLSDYLPNFLVENKSMYSILSLGIHELDEKTCLAHFDALRVGIEIILDEQLDKLRKKEKMEEAKKKLIQIKNDIKKN